MRDLWSEVGDLSPKLLLEEFASAPAGMSASQWEGAVSEVWQDGAFTGVRYLGIPSGYEFGPLIETLVEVSRGDSPQLGEGVVEWLRQVDTPLHFEVFVTPT